MNKGENSMNLTLDSVNRRLRILEMVVFVSLILNLASGFLAMRNAKHVQAVEQQTGAHP